MNKNITFKNKLIFVSGGVLTSSKAFTSIALLNIIRFPMGMLPNVINSIILANESLKRFIDFFNSDEVKENEGLNVTGIENENPQKKTQKRSGVDLVIENAEFFWDTKKTKKAFAINGLGNGESKAIKALEIKKGEFVMVVGTVGSGKSAFLSATLGELVRAGGPVAVNKEIAYVAQTPWVLFDKK